MTHNIDEAYRLIKRFEGFSAMPYLCPSGVWTIGYGQTITKNGKQLKGKDAASLIPEKYKVITLTEAQELLYNNILELAQTIENLVKIELNNNQFCALVSLVYNIGIGNFQRSTLLERINNDKIDEVPEQILHWTKANGKELAGLNRRREAEVELWARKIPPAL